MIILEKQQQSQTEYKKLKQDYYNMQKPSNFNSR